MQYIDSKANTSIFTLDTASNHLNRMMRHKSYSIDIPELGKLYYSYKCITKATYPQSKFKSISTPLDNYETVFIALLPSLWFVVFPRTINLHSCCSCTTSNKIVSLMVCFFLLTTHLTTRNVI